MKSLSTDDTTACGYTCIVIVFFNGLCHIVVIAIVFVDSYGDMPVHNLLWRECAKSSSDISARLAVIPLVQVPDRYSFLLFDACPKYILYFCY